LKSNRLDTLILPAVAALVVLADQLSKHLVMTRVAEGQSWDVAPWLAPLFRITHVTNTGAAFGMFRGWGDFFMIVAVVVVVVIIVYYHQVPDGQRLIRMALGLQLGGAIGNLVDRLRQGSVVDFIDLNFWPLHEWPVFNLADGSLVAGATLLAVLMIWEERRALKRQQALQDG
jgi:signal peptidase II